ncbi:MAG: hypothetical protein H6811_00525 [Phycisphaeraceae bacterium]|nr:hypothetical protein [Phycisphaeraceae bacterium]
MLGSCGRWLFAGGGIEIDPEHPGFERFVIRPRIEGSLTWARTRYRLIAARFRRAWRLEDGRLTLGVRFRRTRARWSTCRARMARACGIGAAGRRG